MKTIPMISPYFLRKALRGQKIVSLLVESDSMSPTIQKGDMILVCSAPHIHIGNILIYAEAGNFFAHRFVFKLHGKLGLKGDNTNRMELVSRSQVLGRVVEVIYKQTGNHRNITSVPQTIYGLYISVRTRILFLFSVVRLR